MQNKTYLQVKQAPLDLVANLLVPFFRGIDLVAYSSDEGFTSSWLDDDFERTLSMLEGIDTLPKKKTPSLRYRQGKLNNYMESPLVHSRDRGRRSSCCNFH
jgi:hypothetical protein